MKKFFSNYTLHVYVITKQWVIQGEIQAYLRVIAGSATDHCNQVRFPIKFYTILLLVEGCASNL